jgi:hypothetical protein
MQEDKDAKIIMDLIASASKAASSTPTSTPKVQNTFVIHGGSPVFLQGDMAFHLSPHTPTPNDSGS